MTDTRPSIAPDLLAALLDAAPSRVRRKLDAAPRAADDWEWTAGGEGWTVLAGTETATLTGPELTEPEQVGCTCLLSPRCLHLLAAVSLLELLDPEAAPIPAAPTTSAVPAAPESTVAPTATSPASTSSDPLNAPVEVDDAARTAAHAAWSAGARVLASGVRAGAAHRSDLLRASALARTARLPRLAAACATVAAGPRDHDTHHFALGEYTESLTALLDVSWRLGGGPGGDRPVPTLAALGVGRRSYTEIGSLRLHGLGTERVATASGHAGVVTHLVSFGGDGSPSFWRIGDVAPGEGGRADQAYAARVNFGGTSRSHRELGRAGLIAQRVQASADGRLGGGAATTAAMADSRPWDAEPLVSLWNRPFGEQLSSALAAQTAPIRRSGSDLVFVDLTVTGPAVGSEGVEVVEATTGRSLRLASDSAQDTRRAHNLALLARSPGASLRTIARPVPDIPGTLVPLTVEPRADQGSAVESRAVPSSPVHVQTGPVLPEALRGRVNLSLDTLLSPGAARSRGTGPAHGTTGKDASQNTARPGPDLGLKGLERVLARVAEAGREAAPAAGPLVGRLRAHHLPTGAELLAGVSTAGRERVRTPTGESVPPPPDALATAWLAATTYTAAARAHLNALAWADSI